jgi:hypothetical protein
MIKCRGVKVVKRLGSLAPIRGWGGGSRSSTGVEGPDAHCHPVGRWHRLRDGFGGGGRRGAGGYIGGVLAGASRAACGCWGGLDAHSHID